MTVEEAESFVDRLRGTFDLIAVLNITLSCYLVVRI